jgi:hypothetical protein
MHFGSDPDCISKFLEAGFAIRGTSGVFKFNMDMSQQISTVIVQVCIVVPDITPFTVLILSCCQTAQMAKYATAYGDFTIVDGTHNTTVYDLKLIPFTNVDCLGKSVVTGFMLDESENTTTVSESLQLFGLETQGATLNDGRRISIPRRCDASRHGSYSVHPSFSARYFLILWWNGSCV